MEEPPKNTLIILISSLPQSLLATILSRCQQLRFQPLNREEIAEFLVKSRNLTPDEAAKAAGSAHGSIAKALGRKLWDRGGHGGNAMCLLRGVAEGRSLEHWLQHQVWPLEQRWIDPEYVRDGTELAIADLITSGTTCFADMHLYSEVVAEVAAASRIRACVGCKQSVVEVCIPADFDPHGCYTRTVV